MYAFIWSYTSHLTRLRRVWKLLVLLLFAVTQQVTPCSEPVGRGGSRQGLSSCFCQAVHRPLQATFVAMVDCLSPCRTSGQITEQVWAILFIKRSGNGSECLKINRSWNKNTWALYGSKVNNMSLHFSSFLRIPVCFRVSLHGKVEALSN